MGTKLVVLFGSSQDPTLYLLKCPQFMLDQRSLTLNLTYSFSIYIKVLRPRVMGRKGKKREEKVEA